MRPKQILVIDDDEDLSYIICDMLENYGYSVSSAKDSAVLGGIICLLFNDAMLSVLLKAVGISNFETEYTPITLLLPITVICTCFFVFSYLSSGKVKRVEVRELITE